MLRVSVLKLKSLQNARRYVANYFSVLNLPTKFDIDLQELTKNLHKLQREAHPDKGGSVDDSARINAAAQVLRSPHLRGLHLLSLNGVEYDETASQPENMFLFEMMETNESIDESHNLNELQDIKLKNDAAVAKLLKRINQQINAEEHTEALRLLQQMKYRERVSIRVDAKIDSV